MSNVIQWDSEFSVNNETFDEHHQKLVDIINELSLALTLDTNRKKEIVPFALNELLEYVDYHLKAEENFLQEQSYPGFEAHKSEHDRFIKTIKALHLDYFEKRLEIDERLLAFLQDWLINHIKKTDKEYADFFRK